MSQRRKIDEVDGGGEAGVDVEDSDDDKFKVPFNKKYKHTLDSDEEDDEVDKYVLESGQIEGEEEGGSRQEEDIKITPFNMKEELEEGHLDEHGMYIFKDKRDEEKDNWLDNIDWIKVKDTPRDIKDKQEEGQEDPFDPLVCYKKILSFMTSGETVQRAIKRLGDKSKKTVKKRKPQMKDDVEKHSDTSSTTDISKEDLMTLISLADQAVNAGDMDVYERTFEQLDAKLKNMNDSSHVVEDMFEDDTKAKSSADTTSTFPSEQVFWEFKWEDKEDVQIHGSFSNDQMIKWQQEGYFDDQDVFVRQVDKQGSSFHSIKRVDFDLYS